MSEVRVLYRPPCKRYNSRKAVIFVALKEINLDFFLKPDLVCMIFVSSTGGEVNHDRR